MTIKQVADRLVELCRSGKYEKAQQELYADDAVSIEPHATPAFEKETKGLPAILEKARKWEQMVETVHGGAVSEPLIGGNFIAVSIEMDITMKTHGRMNISEIAVYQVKDGKIVSEQFFM
jgi:ketosteroid isomerase-like protein